MIIWRKHRPDPKVEALRKVELFRYCDDRVLNDIACLVSESHFAAGEELCREGEIGRQAFVILDGEAAVEISGTRVGTLGPGQVVGEMALIDRGRRSATVTALSPMTVSTLSVLEFGSLLVVGYLEAHTSQWLALTHQREQTLEVIRHHSQADEWISQGAAMDRDKIVAELFEQLASQSG